ncbi:MAG: transcription-repair coupling factor, partial [Treponema sp.]|nr:transcription-repair coupling factor [Treponema sp.]
MNTLSFPAFFSGIEASPPVSAGVSAFRGGKFPLEIEGAEGAFGALLIAALYQTRPGLFLAVSPTDTEAADLALDLRNTGVPAEIFPWWGALPYREMPFFSAVFGDRVRVLSDLVLGKPGIIIVPERAFLCPLPPPEYIKNLLVTVKPGGAIDTVALARTLTHYGYTRVPRVQVHGEFALRGEVLDILMGGDDDAYRILFDFDRVESIKRFDPLDQSGLEKVDELVIRPLRELIWTDDRIDCLSKNLEACQEFSGGGRGIIEDLISRRMSPGEELLFPLAFEQPAALPDYLGAGGTVIYLDRERLENAPGILDREYQNLYAKARREREVPLPERLLLSFAELAAGQERRVSFRAIKGRGEEGACRLNINCDPPRSFFGNITYLREEFAALIAQDWHIVVAAESEVQAGRIQELLKESEGGNISVIAAPLSAGFSLPEIKLLVISENEIFGRRKRPSRSLKTVRSAIIDTFVELNPGDHVVHVNYGIGLFKGIERIKALGHERDYVKLEYLGEEVVFVPIEQVNMVQRYIGNEGSPPRLDKLG